MKLLLTGFIIYSGIILNALGQNVKIERSNEKDLLISPHDIDAVRSFTDSSHISIKLIQVGNTIGAHPDNVGDAVLSDLLLLVKERFDNKPDVSVNFWVKGQFYNPRDFKFKKADKSLSFRHGSEKNAKSTILIISTDGIEVK